MNKRLSKLFATILVTAMILSATPMVMPTKAAALTLPAVWIEPDTLTFSMSSSPPGMKFNVTVFAGTTSDVFMWKVFITFNTSQIKIDRAGYTGTGGITSAWFNGHSTSKTTPGIDNSTNPGSMNAGETLFPPDSVPASSGSVMWLEFEIVGSPAPGTNITSLITPVLSGTKRCKLVDIEGREMTGVSAGDAIFTYIWFPPANPHMEVWNETSIAFDSRHWIGTTFVEDVYIASVNSAWWLTNASTQWSYNSVLLAVSAVSFPALWDNYTNFDNTTAGSLILTAASNEAQSGNILLAQVTFKIISEQTTTIIGTFRSSPRILSQTALASSIYPAANPIGVNPQTNKGGEAPPILQVIVYDFLVYGFLLRVDLNNDGIVDIQDIATVAMAFMTSPGDPRWNPAADINGDGIVDIMDIALVAQNFMQTYP